jgi:rare lipoprotein A
MARRRRGAGISTLFVILGLVGVLGGTFAAGFFTGRHWERVRVMTGLVKPQAGRDPERRALAGKPADAPVVPAMTFYQELTAPLGSLSRQGGASPLPPVPPTGRSQAAPADAGRAGTADRPTAPSASAVAPTGRSQAAPADAGRAGTADRPTAPSASAGPSVAPVPDAEPKAEAVPQAAAEPTNAARADRARGYTVQVAAYATRAQAESLVQRLGALGFESDVSETTTPGGVRYRVRVGTYPTKEAAREAAGRLGATTNLGGFVATR